VLFKRVTVLVAAAMMVLTMLAASAPAFAQECGGASCEPNPGGSAGSSSNHQTLARSKPGGAHKSPSGTEHGTQETTTGRGERISESSP
jgi:hypothetical protein